MSNQATNTNLAHPFWPVKSQLNTRLPLFADSMIHHKPCRKKILNERLIYRGYLDKRYGVSSSHRVLTRGLLLKKFDQVRDCLQRVPGLTKAQREVTLKLLRYWAYYSQVFPKAATLAGEYEPTPEMVAWRAREGLRPISRRGEIGRATVWRTIRILKDQHLLSVVNRYVIRPHAQISNLYRLDKLLILIARYLAEHGAAFKEKWLQPYLTMPGREFWQSFAVGGDTLSRGSPRLPFRLPWSPLLG